MSKTTTNMPQRRIMLFYIAILLLLQKLGGGHCTVTLLQPPAIAAMQGSSVNLSCQLQLNGVKVDRVNIYWLVPDVNDKVKEYLYPRPRLRSTRINSSRLVYPVFINDLSLTIDDVQPSYTDNYICETSLVIGQQNQKPTGKGTYLLVYEEFMVFKNHSDIVCQVKVQVPQNVDLVWEFQGQEYDNASFSLIPSSDNSYWIISVLTNWTQWCQNQQNMTFTCKLRYMQQSLVERNIQDFCKEEFITFFNHSDVVCQAKIQVPQNVDLVWEFQGQEYDNVSSSLISSSDNSYRIISVLSNWTQWCQTQQNTTFTCKFRYMRQSLAERNIPATCAGDLPASYSAPQPILLYVLILGNTLLILFIIIIIIFFWKKKERKRRVQVVAPYPTFPSSSKTKYNG